MPSILFFSVTSRFVLRLILHTDHYDNPGLTPGLVDSSGVRIYIDDTLRKYDAGLVLVGPPVNLARKPIPPGQSSWHISYDRVSLTHSHSMAEEAVRQQ